MFKILFIIFLMILFISSFCLSFLFNIFYGITFYGFIMIVYFLMQIYFSYRNHCINKKLHRQHWIENNTIRKIPIDSETIIEESAFQCVLLMVGHRERIDYWEKALVSIKNLNPSNLIKCILIIDGNEENDQYMKHKYHEIFDNEMEIQFPVECIQISKRGKRGAIFYGIELIKNQFMNKEKYIDVVLSDSDTELEPSSLIYLQECLRSNLNNGCVTGLLTIYNMKDGILPKIINARYSYAFVIERGCSSYFGCMTCCSGPLSIYNLDKLNELLLQKFITQKFLNTKCEPGDDRHLTNLILAQGYFARQTNLAVAGTEAPETMYRFLNQQLRWSRSYYRELYWQFKAIKHQSYFLSFITTYETLFPFFITIWLGKILFFSNDYLFILKGLIISFTVLLIRTFILIIYLQNMMMIYNLFYYVLYLFFLLPTKLYAIFSLLNNNWVTNPRNSAFQINCSMYFCFLGLWNLLLCGGIIKHILILYGIYRI